MFNLLNWLKKHNTRNFSINIHSPRMTIPTSQIPIQIASPPKEYIIPLQQHLGPEGKLIVNIGDYVYKGQALTQGFGCTVPVHASTSGKIIAIKAMSTANSSGLKELCVCIEPDGLDTWCTLYPEPRFFKLTSQQILQKIQQAGIVDLDGLGSPTASKLISAQNKIHTLIVNTAECESYITANDQLVQEHADEVIEGCRILKHLLKPNKILISIEDNKPNAILALRKKITKQDQYLSVHVVPTKYLSVKTKPLTKILIGKKIFSEAYLSQIGVLIQNVATIIAIKRAVINGQPLIERVVTVMGESIKTPRNFWTRLGAPIFTLLEQTGFQYTAKETVMMGNPLMGLTLPNCNIPIVKSCSYLLIQTAKDIEKTFIEEACIRCGLCVDVCSSGLLPQQLYWYSKGKEHKKAQKYNLFDCIECGACSNVCPSNIPLVQYYRQEKIEICKISQEEERKSEVKLRFTFKQERVEREKLARLERYKKTSMQAPNIEEEILADTKTNNSLIIIKREKYTAQDNAGQVKKKISKLTGLVDERSSDDLRKAIVFAAISRAKTKKNFQEKTRRLRQINKEKSHSSKDEVFIVKKDSL
ncbi:electron transport complex subunit RsxC [Candidatus Hartigia pinicola]